MITGMERMVLLSKTGNMVLLFSWRPQPSRGCKAMARDESKNSKIFADI